MCSLGLGQSFADPCGTQTQRRTTVFVYRCACARSPWLHHLYDVGDWPDSRRGDELRPVSQKARGAVARPRKSLVVWHATTNSFILRRFFLSIAKARLRALGVSVVLRWLCDAFRTHCLPCSACCFAVRYFATARCGLVRIEFVSRREVHWR